MRGIMECVDGLIVRDFFGRGPIVCLLDVATNGEVWVGMTDLIALICSTDQCNGWRTGF